MEWRCYPHNPNYHEKLPFTQKQSILGSQHKQFLILPCDFHFQKFIGERMNNLFCDFVNYRHTRKRYFISGQSSAKTSHFHFRVISSFPSTTFATIFIYLIHHNEITE